MLGLCTQAQHAGSKDLADLGEPLGGGHQVGVEGVRHVVVTHREFPSLLITYRPGSSNVGLHTLKTANISLWLSPKAQSGINISQDIERAVHRMRCQWGRRPGHDDYDSQDKELHSMATHRLPRFTNPDWLKSIAVERLIRFFEPYRPYLLRRGFLLPHNTSESIDFEALAAIVIHPDDNVPRAMVEALYYLHEMACIEQMDDLLAASRSRGLLIDAEPDVSPSDIAVQVWLQYPDLLREQHAEAYAAKQKSFTYFAGRAGGPRQFPHPTNDVIKRLVLLCHKRRPISGA
jgi:hypothetical protein